MTMTEEILVEGVLMLLVSLVGATLNMISVWYFAQVKHQGAFHRLLLTLAIVDTVHLIAATLTFSITNLSPSYLKHSWHYIVPYSLPLAQTSMTGSVYLTISLTVERYCSVVKPFNQLRNKYLRSSLALATPGIMFSVLFTLPNYFMLSTVQVEKPVLEEVSNNSFVEETDWDGLKATANNRDVVINVTHVSGKVMQLMMIDDDLFELVGKTLVPAIQFADFRSNQTYITVYVMWLHLLFNTIIPFAVLLILNTSIYKRLVSLPQRPVRRSTENVLRRREVRLARISLLIVAIFIICHSLKIIPSTLEIMGYPPELIPGVLSLSHLLLTINCSVNFLVYYLGSGRALSRLLPSALYMLQRSSTSGSTVSTRVSTNTQVTEADSSSSLEIKKENLPETPC